MTTQLLYVSNCRTPTKVTVQEMVDRFSDFHPAIVKALTNATETGVWQLRDRSTLPTLVKGCFALVGDAAHAMGPRKFFLA